MSLGTRGPTRLLAASATLICFAATAVAASPATAGLVAPRTACNGQKNVEASERRQEDALRCLINFARNRSGAGNVGSSRSLERAAGQKAGDVMRCGFSHTACGHPADLYARRYGYANASSWQWGENLAWGRDKRGTARMVVKAWLHSPPHREAMLRASFDDAGIGLRRGGKVAVWALELGCQGC
jgi:uncharacterized protein YkwD